MDFFQNAINIICIKMHLSIYLSHVTPSRLYGRLFTVIQEVIGKQFLLTPLSELLNHSSDNFLESDSKSLVVTILFSHSNFLDPNK